VKIEPQHNFCIWCGCILVPRGTPANCADQSAPRPRSLEHIIPDSAFGRLTTTDLCKCCNGFLGHVCDHSLVNDKSFVDAAKLVGLKETDLWARFDGTQITADGKTVRIRYSNESFEPLPEFGSLDSLSVPIFATGVRGQHGKNFANLLKQRVRRDKSSIESSEVDRRVEDLVARIQADPTKDYFDPVIGQGVRRSQLNSLVTYTRETRPWETHWCLAKICFELSQLLWPINYRHWLKPISDQWKHFLTQREHSSDKKKGLGIFRSKMLPVDKAAPEHVIEGLVSASQVSWDIRFFGTAQWVFCDTRQLPGRMPGPALRFRIVNPIQGPDVSVDLFSGRCGR